MITNTYNAGPFFKLSLAYFLGFWSLITLLLLSSGPAYAEWPLQTPVGNLQNNSKPIELDLSALVQVGGGFGPNGTWLAAPAAPVKTLGPNGTW